MKNKKDAKTYAKMYSNVLFKYYEKNKKEAYEKFFKKFMELTSSLDYNEFKNKYGKVLDLNKIYVGITTYFVSIDYGYSFEEAKEIYYKMARPIWKKASKLVNFIERLPNGFKIFSKFLYKFNGSYGDSIKYAKNELGKEKYEYIIIKCPYIEIFEHYGIRKYCKVMCDSDIGVMGKAHVHAKFIRHSDLSDSDSCHDELIRVKKINE